MSEVAQTKLLVGLIGAGIQRSLTPAMHEEEARHHGLRLHYQPIDLDRTSQGAEALPALLAAMRTIGFAGVQRHLPVQAGDPAAARRAARRSARDGRGEYRRPARRQAHRPQHRRLGLEQRAFRRQLPGADLHQRRTARRRRCRLGDRARRAQAAGDAPRLRHRRCGRWTRGRACRRSRRALRREPRHWRRRRCSSTGKARPE